MTTEISVPPAWAHPMANSASDAGSPVELSGPSVEVDTDTDHLLVRLFWDPEAAASLDISRTDPPDSPEEITCLSMAAVAQLGAVLERMNELVREGSATGPIHTKP